MNDVFRRRCVVALVLIGVEGEGAETVQHGRGRDCTEIQQELKNSFGNTCSNLSIRQRIGIMQLCHERNVGQ